MLHKYVGLLTQWCKLLNSDLIHTFSLSQSVVLERPKGDFAESQNLEPTTKMPRRTFKWADEQNERGIALVLLISFH